MLFQKIWVFLKRDFLTASSYKFAFFWDAAGIIGVMLTFFFISELFQNTQVPLLEPYGSNYFSFVIIGVAFSTYLGSAIGSFGGQIGMEQGIGTMEALLMTPTKISTLFLAGSVWNILFTSIRVTFYLLVGIFFFHMEVKGVNFLALATTLVLSLIPFISLGIISASFILVFKRGEPISFLFHGASKLLAGAFFPVAVLPLWFKKLSMFIPLTYSLKALRGVLLTQSTWQDIGPDLFILLLFSLCLFPLSVASFKYGLKVAKRQASLVHY